MPYDALMPPRPSPVAGWPLLRQARHAKHLDQAGLARAIKRSYSFVRNLENGLRAAGDATLFELAKALEIPFEELLASMPKPKRAPQTRRPRDSDHADMAGAA